MATTDNLHLYIFDVDDYADVEVINANMQLIDEGWQSLNNRGSANSGKFLRVGSDGVVSPYTISNATQSAAGFMSAADKLKLDGIENNANKYSLPLAANGTRGGVQVGYTQTGNNYPVQLSSEKMYVNVPDVTTSARGLMTSADKTKLNGIEANANNYSLPRASSVARGGVKIGYSADDNHLAVWLDDNDKMYVPINNATTAKNGLMSYGDKSKLNGIAAGANNYSLPLAGSSQRGGVKVGGSHGGNSFDSHIDSNEFLYVTVPDATTSAPGTMSAADKTKLNGIASNANKYMRQKREVSQSTSYIGGMNLFELTLPTIDGYSCVGVVGFDPGSDVCLVGKCIVASSKLYAQVYNTLGGTVTGTIKVQLLYDKF